MRKLRCAVAGLGRIGSLLEDDRLREKPATHAGAIAARRDCVLVGGCDPDPGRRAAFARRWRCRGVFAGVDELLEAGPPDILHVASPPETHLPIVRAAARAGVAVIVCEKPLAASLGEAESIERIASRGPARILTNHERRYSRDYIAARSAVSDGRWGSLLSIAARLYMGRSRPAAEILLHDGTHLVDIIAFLTGRSLAVHDAALERVAAGGRGAAARKVESLLVRAAAGAVPVVMEIASGRDHVVFELDLSFERGRLRIGNGLYEEHESGPSPFYQGMRSLRRLARRRPAVTGYFSGMMADAAACARDPRRRPVSSAADGADALRVVDAALRAAGAGSLRARPR